MSDVRPIDANALVEKIVSLPDYARSFAGKEAIYQIEYAPTLDYAPVKRGKWVPYGDDDQYEGSYSCSVCKAENFFAFDEQHYHYCPYCGAKMDGKEALNDTQRP